MRRVFVLVTVLALLQFGLVVGGGASTARVPDRRLACGDTITVDTTLHADLVDCPNNGVVIGADDITLDLNGHTIDGDADLVDPCTDGEACDIGVDNTSGYSGLTIVGGTIRDFGLGVFVLGARQNRLTHLSVARHIFVGVLIIESRRIRVRRDVIRRNGLDTDQAGLVLIEAERSRIAHNRLLGNGDIGLLGEGSNANWIVDNSILDNPEAGMQFDGSDNRVRGNRVRGGADGIVLAGDDNIVGRNRITGAPCPDCGYGISFEGGLRNVVQRNVISRARWGIRVDAFTGLARRTVVRANVVLGAEKDNIVIDREQAGRVVGTLVQRNVVIRAGDDGIDVENPSTTLVGNVAVRNHDLGIEAVPGVTDGGGNQAAGNGDPRQCTNVAC